MHSLPKPPSNETAYRPIFKTVFFLILTFFTHDVSPPSHAQETGDQAELMRLRDTAEEAMSMGDPHGAALNSGKAALMAALLAKQATLPAFQANFKRLEALLCAQEHVYRAIALFQQSGEPIPASSGVCQTISMASTHREKAEKLSPNLPTASPLLQNLSIELKEWKEMIEELQNEFGCGLAQEN